MFPREPEFKSFDDKTYQAMVSQEMYSARLGEEITQIKAQNANLVERALISRQKRQERI